jgi:hypothetical protein
MGVISIQKNICERGVVCIVAKTLVEHVQHALITCLSATFSFDL